MHVLIFQHVDVSNKRVVVSGPRVDDSVVSVDNSHAGVGNTIAGANDSDTVLIIKVHVSTLQGHMSIGLVHSY